MKKTKRELLVLAAATTVALSMGVTVQAKGDEKVLNFGCQMYTDGCVNSANDENGGWNAMRYGIAEALFKFDDNMEVIPWLAESYEVNDEHTEWTIKLKDGIKFSDGCDLTPTKVKEYFDHMKEVGPSGSAKPEKYLEFEAEVTVDDDANTINIKTSKPYANLVGQLCHPTMGITDVEHIENYDNGIIGTGPYKIEEFNGVGVGYTLAANEYYREDVPYDKVNLLFMGDNSAKTMALQSGQVDLVENITNVADIQDFQDNDDYTVDIASGVRCGFAWMNFDGVLGNKTLRQAILMAIDNDTICNSRTIGGLYTPGFSVLPSTLNYDYDKLENPYTYDPEKAKQILDDAGIVHFGYDETAVMDVKGIKVGLVGIYELYDHLEREQQLKDNIAKVKADGAQLIVVIFHWGNETETVPDSNQTTLGRIAIDEGADLVCGHHPHVLQGIETYKGSNIVYSLGNFCFAGNSSPSDMDTMIYQQTFTIDADGVKKDNVTNIIPCSISSAAYDGYNNYHPTPAEGDEATRILGKINERSSWISTAEGSTFTAKYNNNNDSQSSSADTAASDSDIVDMNSSASDDTDAETYDESYDTDNSDAE